MLKNAILSAALFSAPAAVAYAQNTNATRARQTTTTTRSATTQAPQETTQSSDDRPIIVGGERGAAPKRPARASAAQAGAASERAVRAAFDALIDAITRTSVEDVMDAYWNSPQLVIFNNNGTVTRSWAQVRENLASRYPDLKDVKIAVRDVRVQALGADAAVVTCLWTQNEVYKGTPDTSSGRLTLVFRRIGNAWKVTHRHTSPDRPDPSLVPASERVTETTVPAATPARP